MNCRFCDARRLESGQFNCETDLRPGGAWVRGWLCMYRTRHSDMDFDRHVRPDLRNYTRPEYAGATAPQMDLF